jgi:hypothetical protein
MPTINELIIAALSGFLFSNLRKFISLRRKGTTIDYKFTMKEYINMDWDIMLSQLIPIALCLMSWEFAPVAWVKYGVFIFAAIGAIGVEILNTFFSKAETFIVDKIKNFIPGQSKSYGVGPGPVGTPPPPPPPPPPTGN